MTNGGGGADGKEECSGPSGSVPSGRAGNGPFKPMESWDAECEIRVAHPSADAKPTEGHVPLELGGLGLPLGSNLDVFTPTGEGEGASTARSHVRFEGACTVAEMEPQIGGREAECVQGDGSDVTEMTGNVTAPWV